jgi:hypothetical protein
LFFGDRDVPGLKRKQLLAINDNKLVYSCYKYGQEKDVLVYQYPKTLYNGELMTSQACLRHLDFYDKIALNEIHSPQEIIDSIQDTWLVFH